MLVSNKEGSVCKGMPESQRQGHKFVCGAGAHVLLVGRGCAVPALLCARAGAEQVTCIEGSRMLFRMCKQILQENRETRNAAGIHLLDRPLQAIRPRSVKPDAPSQGEPWAEYEMDNCQQTHQETQTFKMCL